jgi:hypothetical protein
VRARGVAVVRGRWPVMVVAERPLVGGRAVWVLSPTDGHAHLLAIEAPGDTVLTTRCGQSLPTGVLRYDRLPSRHLCRDCVAAYLLPPHALARDPGCPPAEHRGSQRAAGTNPSTTALDRVPTGPANASAEPGRGCGDPGVLWACGVRSADHRCGLDNGRPAVGLCLARMATRTAR